MKEGIFSVAPTFSAYDFSDLLLNDVFPSFGKVHIPHWVGFSKQASP